MSRNVLKLHNFSTFLDISAQKSALREVFLTFLAKVVKMAEMGIQLVYKWHPIGTSMGAHGIQLVHPWAPMGSVGAHGSVKPQNVCTRCRGHPYCRLHPSGGYTMPVGPDPTHRASYTADLGPPLTTDHQARSRIGE